MPDQTARHDGLGVVVDRTIDGEYVRMLAGIEDGAIRGRWFPTDADALAEMRERIAQANPRAWLYSAEYRAGVETVLRALGLTT